MKFFNFLQKVYIKYVLNTLKLLFVKRKTFLNGISDGFAVEQFNLMNFFPPLFALLSLRLA